MKKVNAGKSGKRAQAARAAQNVAAVSSKVAKVTRAVHGAVIKALPKARMRAVAGPGGIGLPGTGGAQLMGARDPVEPKLSVYVVYVIEL